MMGWLRKRFGEKSTYAGLGIAGALLTALAGPEYAQEGAMQAGLILSIYEMIRAEKRA